MREQSNATARLLIRDGAGESSILRIKSSATIAEQKRGLVRIPFPQRVDNIPEEIGSLARVIARSVANIVPRIRMISFRPNQVILDLGAGTVWTEKEENAVIQLMDQLLNARGLETQWSVQRRAGETARQL